MQGQSLYLCDVVQTAHRGGRDCTITEQIAGKHLAVKFQPIDNI